MGKPQNFTTLQNPHKTNENKQYSQTTKDKDEEITLQKDEMKKGLASLMNGVTAHQTTLNTEMNEKEENL